MAGSADSGSADDFINIRNQATLSFAGSVADVVISFAGIILFANVLGADGFGKFYVILAIIRVFLFPITGVGQSVMKRGSEQGIEPSAILGGGLVYAGCYLLLVGAPIAGILIFDTSLLVYGVDIVTAAFAVFLSRAFFLLLLDAYRGRGKTGYATITDNALGILETIFQVVLLLAGLGVFGLLTATAIATTFVSLALLRVSDIHIGRPTFETLRTIWRFARWSVLTSGLGTIYDRLPVLVLGGVLGNVAAGYYTSAMRLLMLGSYVGGSIAPALMVRASASSDSTTKNRNLSELELSMQYASILAIPMMFGSIALPEALMRTIFGPTFAAAGPVLIGLSVYHIVNTYDTVTYSFFDGIDRPDYSMKATLLSLTVRVIAIVLLAIEFGIMGVVAAVVLSHTVHLFTAQAFLFREFGQSVIPVGSSYQIASGVIMWAIVTYAATVVPLVSWAHLLAVVGIGAVCYMVILLVIHPPLGDIVRAVIRDAMSAYEW